MIELHIAHKGQITQASAKLSTAEEVRQVKNRHVRLCLVDLQDLLKDFTDPWRILWAPLPGKMTPIHFDHLTAWRNTMGRYNEVLRADVPASRLKMGPV